MKTNSVRHSFSTRVSLHILLIAGIVFSVAFASFYHAARRQVQADAERHARSSLNNTVLQMDNVLHAVEVAVANNACQVARLAHRPDSLYGVVRQMLAANPLISGSAIAFEPDYYPERGRFFSPYAYRTAGGDSIAVKQLGTDNYDYHHMDWYQIPKLLDKPYWSEPYFDDGGGEIIMTTYSLPLYDSTGRMYAIFTADLSLEWLTQMVNSLQLYPHSYNLMVGRSGAYLAHPITERILDETVFTATLDMADTTIAELGRRMTAGEEGFMTIQNDSLSTSYVFYAPVKRSGWSMAVACTYKDIFSGVDSMRTRVLAIAGTGLLLLLLFCLYDIRQLVRPLRRLADATRTIAQGNLTAPLPPLRRRGDEMGMLYDSFHHMQHSLADYMDELARTTANKERIESELRIASDIQMGMIPKIFPPFPDRKDIDLYATLTPAKEVGGDLYDFFVEDDRLYFTVGDVSGKGVPASLLMAVTRSLFRTMAPHFKAPADIVAALNDALSDSNESNMFVTLFLGVLNLKDGTLRYCNAGHNAPVRFGGTDSGDPAFIPVNPNLALGLFKGFPYLEQEMRLEAGTSLLLYTDGVTEAEDLTQQLFSDERLLNLLARECGSRPARVVEHLMQAIRTHTAEAEQNDDITILCLSYEPNGEREASNEHIIYR